MPTWFPWIFIGGLLFIVLSVIGSKFNEKPYKKIQYLQDFISGSILITFVGVLMPDIFPVIQLPLEIPSIHINQPVSSDFDLQIGPPRLIGK